MKRSSQVVLLLAGVTTAGASGYALMSPNDCGTPERPATVAVNQPQSRCSTSNRSYNSWHSYGSNRSSEGSSSHSSSSSSSTHASLGGGTSWGGFGSIGHAFHSSGS
ncbi:MAG TPA: hypothetical protein VGM57_07360 [Pseudolabrys sp.]